VVAYIVDMRKESLQVSYPTFERIGAGALVYVARNVRSLLWLGMALAGLESAVLFERLGGSRRCFGRFGMLALLRHDCWLRFVIWWLAAEIFGIEGREVLVGRQN
jgi:hypothetical protein